MYTTDLFTLKMSLLSAIDSALDCKDKNLFIELSGKLNEVNEELSSHDCEKVAM